MLFNIIQKREITGLLPKSNALIQVLNNILHITGTDQYKLQIKECVYEIEDILKTNIHFSVILHDVVQTLLVGSVECVDAPDFLLELFSEVEEKLLDYTIDQIYIPTAYFICVSKFRLLHGLYGLGNLGRFSDAPSTE